MKITKKMLIEFNDLENTIKALKERKDALKSSMINYLKDEKLDELKIGKYKITLSEFDQKRIDTAKVKSLLNDKTPYFLTVVSKLKSEVLL